MSDAEVSSARLGSDFEDARYHSFNERSVERAQQRTRRQQIGMECVAGAGLMVAGMVFFTPKRKAPKRQVVAEPVSVAKAPVPPLPATVIQNRYAPYRRRPNGSLYSAQRVE